MSNGPIHLIREGILWVEADLGVQDNQKSSIGEGKLTKWNILLWVGCPIFPKSLPRFKRSAAFRFPKPAWRRRCLMRRLTIWVCLPHRLVIPLLQNLNETLQSLDCNSPSDISNPSIIQQSLSDSSLLSNTFGNQTKILGARFFKDRSNNHLSVQN